MLDSEKLTAIETMTGEHDEDVLTIYNRIAGDKILARLYPWGYEGEKTVPEKYHSLQIEIAVYLINKRGAEGETTHNENGISRTYGSADVPPIMLRAITPYCGVPE